MPSNTTSYSSYKLPAGFDIRVMTKERAPDLGEPTWAYAIRQHDRLEALVMGELWSRIPLPAMVFVQPAPEQLKTFTVVGGPDIEEAMARKDKPTVGSQAVGWYMYRSATDSNDVLVRKGTRLVTTVHENWCLEIVKPFERDDPRHIPNWPPGLFADIL
ncbi:hypothetical protein BDW74DRAFT_183870 [Aspergillus multicolor]|uniref:uncharacterized protein n=1 Tax=Aspergillus multicolor TaxID=41759 RepID=UPI003CCE2813